MLKRVIARPWHWLGIVVLLLTLTPTAALAQEEGGSDECGDTSTPNLVITAANAGKAGPRLTLAVQTDKNGIAKWNVVFRTTISGTNYVLDSYDIHRVFLKGHEGEETVATSDEGNCGGGDEGGCGEDEAGMTGAGIRGLGVVNGQQVRFQIDLKDYGNTPDMSDQIRIRWRDYDPNETGMGESGNCSEKGWTNNTWASVLQINIHQR